MAFTSPLTSCTHSSGIIIPSLIEQRTGELSVDGLRESRSNNFKRKSIKSNLPSLQSKNESRIGKKRTLKHKSRTISSIEQRSSRSRSSPRGRQSVTPNRSIDYASFYQLSNLVIQIEPIPNAWAFMYRENYLDKNDNKMCKDGFHDSCQANGRSSPILCITRCAPSATISRTRSVHTDRIPTDNFQSDEVDSYSGRMSPILTMDLKYETKCKQNKCQRRLRRKCRSSILIDDATAKIDELNSNGDDIPSLSVKTINHLRLDDQEDIEIDRDAIFRDIPLGNTSSPSSMASDSSSADSSLGISKKKRKTNAQYHEPVLMKRRVQTDSNMIVQINYCTFYPIGIPRCIDCQDMDIARQSKRSVGCRFQHCRKLRCLDDHRYEIDGFTASAQYYPENQFISSRLHSNTQPIFSRIDAQYLLIQLGNLFFSIFQHEEAERRLKTERSMDPFLDFIAAKIIGKRCIPGWREVCDECSTTIFNIHYMCRECGHMICIDCYNEPKSLTMDKRRRLRRTCVHRKSYLLAELIPWNILRCLREKCLDYLSKLNINYSMKFNQTTTGDCLSTFLNSLKAKRIRDVDHLQTRWTSNDCHHDPNIEFYCNGRLPVFNEWKSSIAKWFFRKVWTASCPVLVKQVHKNLSPTLWSPSSFKSHMIDHRETPALWDCETLTPISTNETILTRFWDGFERLDVRLRDENHGGRLRILKLKDWPTKKDFASVFPTRLHDLMENIPFSDYTRRSYIHEGINYHGGSMNIVERLPFGLVKPDLGPKLYIAYSQLTSQAARKAGTTNLHIDVSDAVNVLVYVGIGGYGVDGIDKIEEQQQVEFELLKSKLDDAQLQRLKNGELPGALWHLFRSDDVKYIREYLGRNHRKVSGSDFIHDQITYLEQEDLDELKSLYNVHCYPILQFLGDAVFIPSGAPHQVKNLHSCIKIAEDFVSPENLDRCLITTDEFRFLSKSHTNHADILQAKNILYYAMRDAFDALHNNQNMK